MAPIFVLEPAVEPSGGATDLSRCFEIKPPTLPAELLACHVSSAVIYFQHRAAIARYSKHGAISFLQADGPKLVFKRASLGVRH